MKYMNMITKLGIGNAHPGGFVSTLKLLSHFPQPEGTRILEVGCGTGRTACYLAHQGCLVTGVDKSSVMLEKARRRAVAERVSLNFVLAEAEALPFHTGSFDTVLVESVTVFTDAKRSLREYLRVLKPGGLLLDRELIASGELPPALAEELSKYYGITRLPAASDWLALLSSSGFISPEIWDRGPMRAQQWEDVILYPDPYQHVDKGVYQDPELWKTAKKYEEFMLSNHQFFEHGVLTAQKSFIRSI